MFERVKGKVLENEMLSRHTTFGVGGPAKFWAEPRSVKELKEILSTAKNESLKTFIIGAGSNVLAGDNKHDILAIHLSAPYYRKVTFHKSRVTAGAGCSLDRLISLCCSRALAGLEGLTGIPGTVGGAVFMNSSFMAPICDFLVSVKVMDKCGSVRLLGRKDLKFGYRSSNLSGCIILEAAFGLKKGKRAELFRRRKKFLKFKAETQPLGFKSAGCIFKNPEGGPFKAAELIELAGLKGMRVGDAQVSPKHANYIVNLKNARASDIIALINAVKKRVNRKFRVRLVTEIKIL